MPLETIQRPSFVLSTFLTGQRHSLYLDGPDLLHVRTNSYSERVKRIELDHIQLIVLTRTRGREVTAWVLGACLILGGLGCAAVGGVPGALLAVFILLTLGIPFAVNLLRGPTCRVHLHTAVQREELEGCRRVRAAERVIARLRGEAERRLGTVTALQSGA